MRFHIAHIIPHPRFHGLHGYQEIIDTLSWGLTQLGHEVSAGVNQISKEFANIIFGFHMLPGSVLQELRPDTIVYNLEQMFGRPAAELNPAYHTAAKRFHIWEYSERNISQWLELRPVHPPQVVPVGWAPILKRIAKAPEQDIEVLFYGLPSPDRLKIINDLCTVGLRVMFACGFYGAARDALIARSRIVLNINTYQHARIFEIARVSYLLANAKAVVSDIAPESFIEPDMKDAVAFAPLDQIVATCAKLIESDALRQELEVRGQAIMEKRDIRVSLRGALGAMGVAAGEGKS